MTLVSLIAIITALRVVGRVEKLKIEVKKLKRAIQVLNSERLETQPVEESRPLKSPIEKPVKPIKKSTPKKKKREKKRLLNMFLESGTGIFGVIILVMGLAFLGVYSALNMTAFPRFILFILYSGILYGGGVFILKKFQWKRLSLWLRSAAGAVFLFSCVGSAGIPGLQWIDNPISGLMIIVAGILLNILIAKRSGLEIISTIHMFLALISLSIAPATISTLVVAAAVCGHSIFLSSKKRWDLNLILSTSLFHIFHFYWFQREADGGSIISLLVMLIVSLLTLLFHYREIFSVEKFEKRPFFTHFLTWCYLGVAIFLYYNIIPVRVVTFSLLSIATLLISKRAKQLNIQWLLVTDTLVANLFMILAVVSLIEYDMAGFFITFIISLESLIFLTIVLREKQVLLSRIAYGITTASLFITLFINLDDDDVIVISKIVLIILSSLYYVLFVKRVDLFKATDQFFKRIYSIFPTIATLITFFQWIDSDYTYIISALLLAPIFYFAIKESYRGVYRLSIVAITIMMLVGLVESNLNIPYMIILLYCVIKREKIFIPLLLIQMNLVVLSLEHLSDYSPYLPELSWLIMISINLLMTKFINLEKLRVLHWLNYILFTIFATSHLIVIEDITLFRYVIYAVSSVIFIYWIISRPKTPILEVCLIYLITVILKEFDSIYFSLITISIATLLLLIRNLGIPRLSLYSIIFSWLSVLALSFHSWRDGELIIGLVTALIFTVYLILLQKSGGIRSNYILKRLSERVDSRLYPVVFYPFFIGMALFILFSFRPDLITLFFVIESLIIFVLSMVLREQHFKVISMVALGASLTRLIFVDLANSGTLVRALVFIGVGVILVSMNMIYLKLKPED